MSSRLKRGFCNELAFRQHPDPAPATLTNHAVKNVAPDTWTNVQTSLVAVLKRHTIVLFLAKGYHVQNELKIFYRRRTLVSQKVWIREISLYSLT
jgi:hypothetical protein